MNAEQQARVQHIMETVAHDAFTEALKEHNHERMTRREHWEKPEFDIKEHPRYKRHKYHEEHRRGTALHELPGNTVYTHSGPRGERGAIVRTSALATQYLGSRVTGPNIQECYFIADSGLQTGSQVSFAGGFMPAGGAEMIEMNIGQFWLASETWRSTAPQYMEYRLKSIKLSVIPMAAQAPPPTYITAPSDTDVSSWQQSLYDDAEIRIGLARPDAQLMPMMWPSDANYATQLSSSLLGSDPETYLRMPFSKWYQYTDLQSHGRRSEVSITCHFDDFDHWIPTGNFYSPTLALPIRPEFTYAPITAYVPTTNIIRNAASFPWMARYQWFPYVFVNLNKAFPTGSLINLTPVPIFQVRFDYEIEFRRPVWNFSDALTSSAFINEVHAKQFKELLMSKNLKWIEGVTAPVDSLALLATVAKQLEDAESALLGTNDFEVMSVSSHGSQPATPAPAAFTRASANANRLYSRR